MTPEERVLEAYYERLTVFPVDKSRVIAIEFQSADPELAARVANADRRDLSGAAADRASRTRPAPPAAGSQARSRSCARRSAEAEAKVEDFRSKSNLFVGTNNTTLSSQTARRAQPQLAVARAQKAEADARARLIRESSAPRQPDRGFRRSSIPS